ncbi:MAG: GNAT family N-acetyltransferase [Bacteroidales bacterium]|nr:GNAT family N-acetyltransferase [Bacteroidales bacterium]MCB8999746.1 GNAT family N-acetyltransferase [Bacteroidales bacterium]MCB9013444.1 GNAT family N-acetyltransferase [Bacteroidales bacterium]
MRILENARIQLRALEPEDLELLYSWENNPEIWHLSNTLSPFSKFTLEKYIQEAQLDIFQTKQLRLIIQLKSSGEAIGAIDLFDFDPMHKRAGVGILIGDKKFRRKGFASEALEILETYAFDKLGLKQLYCNILEDNSESLSLFIKQGFVITGQKKDWVFKNNNWHSEYFLQLIRV